MIKYREILRLDAQEVSKRKIATNCNYIGGKQNVILKGASGNGKSYLACTFGVSACRNGYIAKYMRLE